MSNFQKIIVALLVIITWAIIYYFVIIPNQNTENLGATDEMLLENNPEGIIKWVLEKTNDWLKEQEKWVYKSNVFMPWFYEWINKWISSKNGYQIEFKVFTNTIPSTVNELLEYAPYKKLIDTIRKYMDNKWFTKNSYNSINTSNYDKWDSYFEWYEQWDIKCSIESILWSLSVDQNQQSYLSLALTCADDFENQKTLQTELLDSVWKYLLISMNWLYVDKELWDFYHAVSVSHWRGGIEMVFQKSQSRWYDVIYAWNSWIPCSVVNQYNIPFHITGECD